MAVFTFGACADLDTEPQGRDITDAQKKRVVSMDPSKAEASVNAIFANENTYLKYSSNDHNDFGLPSVLIFSDTDGYDMVSLMNGYNWYNYSLTYVSHLFSDSDNEKQWNTLYNLISSSNQIIALVEDPESLEDETMMYYQGQAYAMRAYAYWQLAQKYQFTYKGNEDKPCVPLVTEENMASVGSEGAPRATVQEVYDKMLSDATIAVNLLGKTSVERADLRYINKQVALGIRARIELYGEDWKAAAQDAHDAQEGYTPYSMTAVSVPSFNNLSNNTSFLWADILAETDRVVTSGIVNWGGHMCSFCYGYIMMGGWRLINKKLFNLIPSSDVRKGWWLDANGKSANINQAQASYLASRDAPAYTGVKFGPYKDQICTGVNAQPIPLMRVEELILMEAEATAMAGNPSEGYNILKNFVQTYRDPQFEVQGSAPTTGEEVQEMVYFQRRIELWGEGFSWFDIKRLKKNMDRRGGGYGPSVVLNVPYNDPAMLYQIPESEITNNVQIATEDQNPDITLPTAVADSED